MSAAGRGATSKDRSAPGGERNEHAEANIWNDPDAAAEVFAVEWPLTLVGLDMTEARRHWR